MTQHLRRIVVCAVALVLAPGVFSAHAADEAVKPIAIAKVERSSPVDFEKEVLPLLNQSCIACHSKTKPKGGLVLETPADVRKGGENGPAVVAGKSADSLMLKAAAHQVEDLMMPPKGNKANAPNLTGEQLGLIKLWIDQGATGEVRGPAPVVWQAVPQRLQPVYAIAVSPDGKLAAVGRSNAIVLYDLATSKPVARLADGTLTSGDAKGAGTASAAHRDLVQSLAFSPDGKTLASGSYREVKLWRSEPPDQWALARTLGGAADPASPLADRVLALRFSPDGARLATGGGVPTRGGQIQLWDPATGAAGKSFDEVHTDAVTGLAFSPDGKRLASSSADKFVRVTDLDTGKVLRSLEGHTHHALGVAWRRDGKMLASVGADNTIRFWDAETGERKKVVQQGYDKELTSVAYAGDTENVVVTSGDGKAKLVRDNGTDVRSYAGATGFLYCSAASPDGKLVLAGGQDGVVRVWGGADGKTAGTLEK